jgi:methyl-accepting chemotaxis protein
LIGSFEKKMSGAEPLFLDLCGSFQSLSAETDVFAGTVNQTIDMAGGGGGETALAGIGNYTKEWVGSLKQQQKNMADNLAILENIDVHLATLVRFCFDAERIIRLLKVVVINIGIESNRGRESMEMFAAFVKEVRDLVGRMETVTTALFTDAGRIRSENSLTVKELRQVISRLSRLGDQADEQMRDSAKQIETMLERTIVALNHSRESGKVMAGHIGNMVMALQMHDIIRQRSENVLKKLHQVLENHKPEKRFSMRGKPVPMLDSSTELEKIAREIDGIAVEVDKIQYEAASTYQGIERCLSSLYQDIRSDMGMNGNSSYEKNPFTVLSENLKTLGGLIHPSLALNRTMAQRITEASDKIGILGGYVKIIEEVSLDLHRKSLNAIIKAAHLGEAGRGIEVFAQEVGTASRESNGFAEHVVALISNIGEMIRSLRESREMAESMEDVSERFEEHGDAITRSYKCFKVMSDRASEQFGNIESVIGETRSRFDFLHMFSCDLKTQAEKLRDIFKISQSDHLRVENPEEFGFTEQPACKPIQDAEGAGGFPVAGPDGDETSKDQKDSGLGDNVELF